MYKINLININIIKKIFNKIRQILNILIFLAHLLPVYTFINIGYYYKSNNDLIRRKYINYVFFFLSNGIKYSLGSRINTNKHKINLEKITIINANHIHPNDLFIFFYLFNVNNIKGENISSISSSYGLDNFSKKVLNMISAIMVSSSYKDIINISSKFKIWNKQDYNISLITFFEGIALKDTHYDKNKIIGKPKTVGFYTCIKNTNSKFMYDINLVYKHKNRLMNPKKSNFTMLLFHPETKIYAEVNKYKLPELKNSIEFIQELYLNKEIRINKLHKVNQIYY